MSPWRAFDPYAECNRCTERCRTREDADRQAIHRCPHIPRRKWLKPGLHFQRYMGGPTYDDGFTKPTQRDHREAMRMGGLNLEEPFESNADGCPGAWYRTPFFLSLARYLRVEAEGGALSSNILLDRCEDPLVLDAVYYFEAERQRWHSWKNKAVALHRSMTK